MVRSTARRAAPHSFALVLLATSLGGCQAEAPAPLSTTTQALLLEDKITALPPAPPCQQWVCSAYLGSCTLRPLPGAAACMPKVPACEAPPAADPTCPDVPASLATESVHDAEPIDLVVAEATVAVAAMPYGGTVAARHQHVTTIDHAGLPADPVVDSFDHSVLEHHDSAGQLVWRQELPGTQVTTATAFIEGTITVFGDDGLPFLARYDLAGEPGWKIYQPGLTTLPRAARTVGSNDIATLSDGPEGPTVHMWSPGGTVTWAQAHAGRDVLALAPTADEEAVALAGHIETADGGRQPWIARTDGTGAVVWELTLDDMAWGEARDVAKLPNDAGHCVVVLGGEAGSPDLQLVEVDASGDVANVNHFGPADGRQPTRLVLGEPELVIAGTVADPAGGVDGWLMGAVFDLTTFEHVWGEPGTDEVVTELAPSGDGWAVGGWENATSAYASAPRGWLFRTGDDGLVPCEGD